MIFLDGLWRIRSRVRSVRAFVRIMSTKHKRGVNCIFKSCCQFLANSHCTCSNSLFVTQQ